METLREVVSSARRLVVPGDGVDLAVLVWPGDGDVVVFAHPTGFHKEIWAATVRALRAAGCGGTLVAVDLRGHGDTPRPAVPPDVWGYASDVGSVAARFTREAERKVGVGHSLGGMAVTAAQIRYRCFDRLVLIDPALISPDRAAEVAADNMWAESARRRRPAFPSRDDAYLTYRHKPVFADWPDEMLALYVDYGFSARDGVWALKCDPDWEAATFSQPSFPEVWRAARGLDVPTTLITAGRSPTHPPDVAESTARHLDARHVRLEDRGHFVPMEAPEVVADAVIDALS
ncbi:MAG: alpha/beta hydrolase [Acidimicrobiia bacterium]|nr:MAG: alpha/beta hydrolase [Acidimicrobiia bacterium]